MTEARGRASALVTGASRGIGLGIAEMLARRGTALTITARDGERLADVAGHLRELGAPEVVSVAGDLADSALPDVLGKRHAEAFGDLGCLVLNAGVGTAAPIGDLPEARLDKTLAVNLRAPVLLLQRLLPLLRAADRARVVVLSSISGVYAEPGLAAYGATKAALNSLVETLNAEESGNGVSATAIAPGYVDTDMSAWTHDRIPPDEMIPVSDVVTLVEALVSLSAQSVVPRILITRAGTSGFEA
ncbi:SDR family oxidoreductase (plasmid) [Georgenia sp. TF02-10]|uniref:SDR family NAD(P)-dependent oxidoreductase n=1 Tax=Georgenia sp. TF02-10 TaxID=2917725 RepID=UPI001FA80894|nr:SDR family oxidoreductase [Georgenia sp. TF02-10]UNX56597.1 SDR family oxidoreductase [Georgenia sp. TF02-10]